MKRFFRAAAPVGLGALFLVGGMSVRSHPSTKPVVVSSVGSSNLTATASASVPELVGTMEQSVAAKQIRSDNATFNYVVVYEPSQFVPPGMILLQSPQGNSQASSGAIVTVVVSSGFPPGYAPPSLP